MDSCVNQLLAITHKIYKSFDEGFEVKWVFLDLFKAFNVWYEGTLFKLNKNSISGNLLKLSRNFLSCRKQWVVLNGQHSSWGNVIAGVPQDFILGPFLLLIFINDLPNDLSSNCKPLDKTRGNNPFLTITRPLIDTIASSYGLNELIQEPTHIFTYILISPSCIHLIFTSQPNLFMESEILSSLHPHCSHLIVFAKFHLSIYYHPKLQNNCLVLKKSKYWTYQKGYWQKDYWSVRLVIRALSNVNTDEKIYFFTNTLLNIIANFITHESIICDDRNPPLIKRPKSWWLKRIWHWNRIVVPAKTCSFSKNLKPYRTSRQYLSKNRKKSTSLNYYEG